MNFDSFLEMKKYTGRESHSLNPQLFAIGESHSLVSGVGFSPGHLEPARRSVDIRQKSMYKYVAAGDLKWKQEWINARLAVRQIFCSPGSDPIIQHIHHSHFSGIP